MTVLGAGLLWFGWFGFNAGSALTAGGLAASAFVVTNTAAAAATLTWVGASYLHTRKVSVVGAACGAVAGLVAITPASGFVTAGRRARHRPRRRRAVLQRDAPAGAAQGRRRARRLRRPRRRRDVRGDRDRRVRDVRPSRRPTPGLIDGNAGQVGIQLVAVGATIAYAVVATFVIVKVVDVILGIRVPSAQEETGLDLAVHGEAAYQV